MTLKEQWKRTYRLRKSVARYSGWYNVLTDKMRNITKEICGDYETL